MRTMRGSPLRFTPDSGWKVDFEKDGNRWSLDMIGWAVVILDYEFDGDTDEDAALTGIEPVVLSTEGEPTTMSDYFARHQRENGAGMTVNIRRA